ncbi:hypothetical protein [Tardiphaga sp.]|jgi:hypothetical protein|uniref:hypothetical protein n=1 Tax=Tardiphaga sp. TaxID=1926292 RepID=UPI0037DA5CAD
MSETDSDQGNITIFMMAQLRAMNRKLDLALDTQQQHGERFGRIERDVSEGFGRIERDTSEGFSNLRDDIRSLRRDIHDVKSDIILLENKVLTTQSEILAILHRVGDGGRNLDDPPADPLAGR